MHYSWKLALNKQHSPQKAPSAQKLKRPELEIDSKFKYKFENLLLQFATTVFPVNFFPNET